MRLFWVYRDLQCIGGSAVPILNAEYEILCFAESEEDARDIFAAAVGSMSPSDARSEAVVCREIVTPSKPGILWSTQIGYEYDPDEEYMRMTVLVPVERDCDSD